MTLVTSWMSIVLKYLFPKMFCTLFHCLNCLMLQKDIFVANRVCLQCLYTIGWASGGASRLKLSDEVLVWLSVWSKVHIQIVCI